MIKRTANHLSLERFGVHYQKMCKYTKKENMLINYV